MSAPQGQTTDPKTGKVFRLQAPKVRSEEFRKLQDEAERARVALVEYCNSKSYSYDIKSGKTCQTVERNGQRGLSPVKGDTALTDLVSNQKAKKEALKTYKKSHPEEFQAPKPGKQTGRRSGAPTMVVHNKPESSG